MYKQIGNFAVMVSDPHPAWVRIRYEGTGGPAVELSLHHREISDLLYLAQWARMEARRKLGEAGEHEVL